MTRIIITPMRLVAALLAAFCMAAGAQAAGKGGLVTLTLTGEPLPQALKLIEQQGGKSILFTYKETERYRVTMAVRGATEAEAIARRAKGKTLLVHRAERLLRGAVQPQGHERRRSAWPGDRL